MSDIREHHIKDMQRGSKYFIWRTTKNLNEPTCPACEWEKKMLFANAKFNLGDMVKINLSGEEKVVEIIGRSFTSDSGLKHFYYVVAVSSPFAGLRNNELKLYADSQVCMECLPEIDTKSALLFSEVYLSSILIVSRLKAQDEERGGLSFL